MKVVEATGSIAAGTHDRRLIVVLRNADLKRHAGTFARQLFGDAGSAGGHKDSARAEVPLEALPCGPDRDADCRRFVLERVRALLHDTRRER